MFGQGKRKGPVANKLSGEAEPNTLSWPDVGRGGPEAEPYQDDLAGAEQLDPAEAERQELDLRTNAERKARLQAELDREAEEFGLANVSAVDRYGPNGDDVEAVFVALDDIAFGESSPDALLRLAGAWKAVDPGAGTYVHSAVEIFRRRGKYVDRLATADWEIDAWLNARTPADEDEAELLRDVAEAARDTVDALILEDELDDADFDTLYNPWAEVMDPIEEDAQAMRDDREAVTAGPTQNPDEPEGAFGPHTDLVLQFLVRLGDLADDQLRQLTAAFNRQSQPRLGRAHEAIQVLATQDPTWRDRIKVAQTRASGSLRPSPSGLLTRRVTDRLPMDKALALPPAIDAVTALVLADLLEPEDAEMLYAPWAEVVGEPKLPA